MAVVYFEIKSAFRLLLNLCIKKLTARATTKNTDLCNVFCLYYTVQAIKCFPVCVLIWKIKQPIARSRIIPILQIKRMRLREIKWLSQDYIAREWRIWGFFLKSCSSLFHTSCFLMTRSAVVLGLKIIYTLVLFPFANGIIASQNSSVCGLQTAFFKGRSWISDIVSISGYSGLISIGNKWKRRIYLKNQWFQ